jgi:septal ring factor EnvC (AmiA/AmiB activator)
MIQKAIRFLIFIVPVFLAYPNAHAQKTKDQLQQEKQLAIQKLNEAQKILEETSTQKETSLGQLAALNNQILAGESLIRSIKQEIDLTNTEITELGTIIKSLESDLAKFKSEYSVLAYNSYKSKFGLRDLTFLFSASTFSQVYLRMKYMEQYASERKKQVMLIRDVRESLLVQEKSLSIKLREKRDLLTQEVAQNQNLVKLKNRQNQLILSLGKKEKGLRQELEQRKKDIARLDKFIADLVAAEIRESSKGTSTDKVTLSGNMISISKSFETSIGRLPWPVSSGFISSRFGTHPHPVYKKLNIPNDGIDIQTNSNEVVRAVFEGQVKAIAFVPGEMKYVVLIQHGEFFTVSAKLREATVKKGQIVKSNDPIGIVSTKRDGVSEIQFQVWKNNQKLNPENWIVRK